MAKTYCMCQGMRGEATRRGGNDGVHVAAQSYNGSAILRNWYNENNELVIEAGTNDGSSCYINGARFVGSLTDYDKLLQVGNICKDDIAGLLQLVQDIKSGKVSITRHRAKSNRMLKLERAFRD